MATQKQLTETSRSTRSELSVSYWQKFFYAMGVAAEPLPPPESNQKAPKPAHARFQTLYQRIGFGYFLAIAIGFAGSVTGVSVANRYQAQATQQLWEVQKQAHALSDFKSEILAAQLNAVELSLLLDRPQELQAKWNELNDRVDAVNALQPELLSHLQSTPIESTRDLQTLEIFLTDCTAALNNYVDRLAVALRVAQSAPPLNESNELAVQQQFMDASNSAEAADLDRLLPELDALLEVAQVQEDQGEQRMEKLQTLEYWILVVSLLGAAAIASLYALYATRAITKPIVAVADVARQVVAESNFDLRAPVTTSDEIGQLADSLNQLIERMEQRHQGLQHAVETAEAQTQWFQQTLQELQSTQAQLIHREKMSSLGQLVAGIAHEINNPANFIHGNVDHASSYFRDLLELVRLYQQQFPDVPPKIRQHIDDIELGFLEEDLPRLLNSIESGTRRIRKLVRSLRNFSRLDEAELKTVDIHEGISSTLLMLNSRLKHGSATAQSRDRPDIKVLTTYGELPPLACYPGQLNQVLMHILVNAIDAIDERWYLASQSAADCSSVPLEIRVTTTVTSAEQVEIQIADTGVGITPEDQAKIFDPFFTTKAIGQGTGLGLSISYHIVVHQHQGALFCTSTPNQGSEFTIQLPIR